MKKAVDYLINAEMKAKDFESFVKMLRKEGVKTLKLSGLELEFSSEALLPPSPYQKRKLKVLHQAAEEAEQMTEDELIAWNQTA